jgi:ABC-2 type transport system ATP-binding protein
MNKTIVQVDRLSHRYSRDWAIRDINFTIDQQGVLGLLGSNGAGKSTTMNIMCGVLRQTEGQVLINGIDLRQHPVQAKQQLGFLPQTAPLHLDLTVDEYLHYCAQLRLMHKDAITPAVEVAKDRCGIAHFSRRLIRNLSGGYRQRVGIAQAIIHRPPLVVLDEPTNGLDPIQILEVRKLIREIALERAVIFSSHILSEVQATCSRIIMIEGGRVVFSDTMDAFNNYIEPDSMVLSLLSPPDESEWMKIEGVVGVEVLDERRVRLRSPRAQEISEQVIGACVTHGWHLQEIMLEKSSLDEIFAQLSRKKTTPGL